MIPSSKKQRQLIAIGCHQAGISAELRHDMLRERYGVDSATKLDKLQAAEFIKELGGFGFQIRSKPRPRPIRSHKRTPGMPARGASNAVRLVTRDELDKIAVLARLINWREKDGLALWTKKRMGIDRVRTDRDAYLVIEGLKAMFSTAMKKRYGEAWWEMRHDDPDVFNFVNEHCPKGFRGRFYYENRDRFQGDS